MQKLKQLVSQRKQMREQLSQEGYKDAKLTLLVYDEIARYIYSMNHSSDISKTACLSNEILGMSEKILFRHVQIQYFSDEISDLQARNTGGVKKQISIFKLDPFESDGLLRIGGRLGQSTMSYDARLPIILPQDSPLSRLILEQTHREVGHMGRNTMLSHLRQQYWIVRANSAIRKLLSRCTIYVSSIEHAPWSRWLISL